MKTYTVTQVKDKGEGSLYWAFQQANDTLGECRIEFDPSLVGAVIVQDYLMPLELTNDQATVIFADGLTFRQTDDLSDIRLTGHVIGKDTTFVSDFYNAEVIVGAGGLLELDSPTINYDNDDHSLWVADGGELIMTDGEMTGHLRIEHGGKATVQGTTTGSIVNKGILTLKNLKAGDSITSMEQSGDDPLHTTLILDHVDMNYVTMMGTTEAHSITLGEYSYLEASNSKLGNVLFTSGIHLAWPDYSITNCEILGSLAVKSASSLGACSGNTFMDKVTFDLVNFSGSTAGLWNGAFTPTQEGSYIAITSFALETVKNIDVPFEVVLTAPPATVNGGYNSCGYILRSSGMQISPTCNVILEDGVCIDMAGAAVMVYGGSFTAKFTEVADALACARMDYADALNQIIVSSGGSFVTENANVRLDGGQGTIFNVQGGLISMKGGTLSVYGTIYAERWPGTESVMNLDGTHITHTMSDLPSPLGEGPRLICTSEMNLSNLVIDARADITCENEVLSDVGGILRMENVTVGAGSTVNIQNNADLKMTNCIFESPEGAAFTDELTRLNFFSGGSVVVNGCDLSAVTIEVAEGMSVDLSGNYWGTTDLTEIQSRIIGFSKANVSLGDILTEAPAREDTLAPELHFNEPVLTPTADGTAVTLSWTCNESCKYIVTVDGEEVYTGPESSVTLKLADGQHTYTVKATDRSGNAVTVQGKEFGLDTAVPEPELLEPQKEKVGEGKTSVTFSWVCNGEPNYVLTINGKKVYEGKDSSYTTTLPDGKYSYELTATSPNGLSGSVEGGSLSLDATAPTLQVAEPTIVPMGSQYYVMLSWSGTGADKYEVVVDGEVVFSERNLYCTLTLAAGRHSYTVSALDNAGNRTSQQGNFVCGAVSPDYQPLVASVEVSKPAAGKATVTISWQGEKGSVYSLSIDGKSVWAGYDTSYSLIMDDGDHSYELTEVSPDGALSTYGGPFSFDATAPVAKLESVVTDKETGLTTITWSGNGDELVTYYLMDGSKVLYSGPATSYQLELADKKYSFTLTAIDAAANTASTKIDFAVDGQPVKMEPGKITVKPGKKGAPATVTLSWKGEKGVTYGVLLDGEEVATTTKTSHILTEVTEGTHRYTIVAKDSGGGELTGEFVVDTIAPVLDITAPGDKGYTNSAAPSISWQGVAGESYTLKVGRETLSFEGEGSHSYTITTGDGKYSYTLTALDQGNNKTTAKGSFTVDTKPVSLTAGKTTVKRGKKDEFATATLSWKGESKASYTLYVDEKEITTTMKTSYKLTEVTEGSHSYKVVATDLAGNTSELTGDFIVDTIAPELNVSAPANKGYTNSAAPSISWQGVAGESYTLKVGRETLSFEGEGPHSYTITTGDGKYSYTLTALDQGNNKTTAKGSFTVDTKPVSLTAGKTTVKRGKKDEFATVTLSWKGESKASYTLYVDEKEITTTMKTSYKLTEVTEGSHSYKVVATDLAGNTSELTGDFIVDTIAPELNVSAPANKGYTNSAAPSISWQGVADESYTLKVGRETLSFEGEGPHSYTITTGDGKYSYTLTALDQGSNKTTAKGSFTVDTKPVSLTAGKTTVKRGKKDEFATATLSWKGESKASYTLYVDEKEITTTMKTSYKLTEVTEGSHSYKVVATDLAGNTSELTGDFIVDTIAPELNLSAPANKGYTNAPSPSISWQGVAGEAYTLKVGRETLSFEGEGPHSYTITTGDGKYSYTLTALDQGNNKTTAKGSFTVDTKAPALSAVAAKATKVVDGALQVTLSWKGESKAAYTISVDGDDGRESSKTSLPLALTDGLHEYQITATDLAGNTSTLRGTLEVDAATKSVTLTEAAPEPMAASLDRELGVSAGLLPQSGQLLPDASGNLAGLEPATGDETRRYADGLLA